MDSSLPKQSFGVQAARFSLYAPLAALIIGVLAYGNREQPGVGISLAVINLLLLISGFILGVLSLVLIRHYGRHGILGRAIGGVVLNGIIVITLFSVLVPAMTMARIKSKIVGHWVFQGGADIGNAQVDMRFFKDETYRFQANRREGPISYGGHWTLTADHVIGLTIEYTGADDAPVAHAQMVALGTVSEIDDHHIVVKVAKGTETYDRMP